MGTVTTMTMVKMVTTNLLACNHPTYAAAYSLAHAADSEYREPNTNHMTCRSIISEKIIFGSLALFLRSEISSPLWNHRVSCLVKKLSTISSLLLLNDSALHTCLLRLWEKNETNLCHCLTLLLLLLQQLWSAQHLWEEEEEVLSPNGEEEEKRI